MNPGTLRMQFAPDDKRMSVSSHWKMRTFAQKLYRGLDFEPVKMPATIVKSFAVYADDLRLYINLEVAYEIDLYGRTPWLLRTVS